MKKLFILGLSIGFLSSCSGVSEQLGLKRQAPDEFAVIKRAPLQLPPDYTLRPPTPGASRPQEISPQEAVRENVLGTQEKIFNAGESKGEQALLTQIGVQEAESDIRQKISSETGVLNVDSRTTAEKLLFLEGDAPKGKVLNPIEESQRLKQELKEDELESGDQKEPIIEKR